MSKACDGFGPWVQSIRDLQDSTMAAASWSYLVPALSASRALLNADRIPAVKCRQVQPYIVLTPTVFAP